MEGNKYYGTIIMALCLCYSLLNINWQDDLSVTIISK